MEIEVRLTIEIPDTDVTRANRLSDLPTILSLRDWLARACLPILERANQLDLDAVVLRPESTSPWHPNNIGRL